MSSEPIADYALLSDCRSAALVSAAGSVDWLCFPRFDSPSVFGRLLGEEAGFWSILPAGEYFSSRRYLGPTMVLETVYTSSAGSVTVTDALVLGDGQWGHDLGAQAPRALLRQVSCTEGIIDVDVIFAPRPEYGLITPLLYNTAGGLLARGGADVMAFSTAAPFEVSGDTAHARLTLRAGEVLGFALHHQHSWQDGPAFWTQAEITRRLADTLQGWSSWSEMHQSYRGPWGGSRRRQRTDPAGPELTTRPGRSWPLRRRPCRK